MTNRLLSSLALLAMACGGSTDDANGSGGTAGTGATGAAGATGGGAGVAGAAGADGGGAGVAGASGSPGNGGVGAFGGGGTGANAACDALELKFYQTLPLVKACPLDSTEPTCNASFDTTIDGCGHFEFGDATNANELSELASIRKEWKALECGWIAVCGVGGMGPMPAHCEAGGAGGTTGTCVPN